MNILFQCPSNDLQKENAFQTRMQFLVFSLSMFEAKNWELGVSTASKT